jgi:polysaccharide export outer membrane protein
LVNNNFSIITEFGSGRYRIDKDRMNIYQALATSQDLKGFTDRAKVKILRQTSGGNVIIKEFDLRSKDIVDSEFYYVQPNDVIYVQSYSGQFFRITNIGTVYSLATASLSVVLTIIALGGF